MRGKIIYGFMNYYIRDKNNKPVISVITEKKLEIFYRGVAICSPFLDFPSKSIGRKIAYGRACKAREHFETHWTNSELLLGYSISPILRKEIITYLHSLKDSEINSEIIENILKFGKSSILRFESLNSFEKNYFTSKDTKKMKCMT